MSSKPFWIDAIPAWSRSPDAGSVHFLLSLQQDGEPAAYVLDGAPALTNRSHEPRLRGYCGAENGLITYAEGLARVLRVAKNGRVLVEPVSAASPEGLAYLEEAGYPELAECQNEQI